MAQEVAVAEAAVPIDRKCRVIWYFVVEIEAAKPAVGEMQFYLLAQLPLKANAIATVSIRIMSSGSIEGRPMSL